MKTDNAKLKRFCIVIYDSDPLVLAKLQSTTNINSYLKDLVFTDMYAHDSLVTNHNSDNCDSPLAEDIHDPLPSLSLSLRIKADEESDILTHLQSKADRQELRPYVISLVYHDLGYHILADRAYQPDSNKVIKHKPETPRTDGRRVRRLDTDRAKQYVHFTVHIPPDHPMVLAKLEMEELDPRYLRDLALFANANEKNYSELLSRPLDETVPDKPGSLHRRRNGCVVRLAFENKTDAGGTFIVDDDCQRMLARYEKYGVLDAYMCSLVYHDIGQHILAFLTMDDAREGLRCRTENVM